VTLTRRHARAAVSCRRGSQTVCAGPVVTAVSFVRQPERLRRNGSADPSGGFTVASHAARVARLGVLLRLRVERKDGLIATSPVSLD
jgi:hypothetical protein